MRKCSTKPGTLDGVFSLELILQRRAKLEYRAVSNQLEKNLAVLTTRSTKENQYVFSKRQNQRCQHSAHLRRSLARRRVHQMERRSRTRNVARPALWLKRF